MAVQYPNFKETFQGVGDRLEIWGTGLIQGQVSIDQALSQSSRATDMLRNNIAGTLADVAVILRRRFPIPCNLRKKIFDLASSSFLPTPESALLMGLANTLSAGHTLSMLGEADTSASTLQLRGLFSIPEISLLPIANPFTGSQDDALEGSISLDYCSRELTALIECLFNTSSTTEMVLKEAITRQLINPALDKRNLLLVKSDLEISLPSLAPAHAKDLLSINLQYIAAMQNSLKDSEFAKYMKPANLKLNAVQLHTDLEEEGRQMKYWTRMLEGSTENNSMTPETKTALILNLARIARTFGESNQIKTEEALL